MITFDTISGFSAATPLESISDLAAAVDYLTRNSLGAVGTAVAFTAVIGGMSHTYVFIEGGGSGSDELVDLQNISAAAITVAGEQINLHLAVTANPDMLTATEDVAVTYTAAQLLGNDVGALGILSVTSGSGGTALLNIDGTVTFTPNSNFNGATSFSYIATEGTLNSNSAIVTVTVAAVNDTPVVAKPVALTSVDDNHIITGNLLIGASDVDAGDVVHIVTTGGSPITAGLGFVAGTTLSSFLTATGFGIHYRHA